MKMFTKLWQWMMILLLSSSVLVAQAQKNVSADKAPAKTELKQDAKSQFNEDQIKLLENSGNIEEILITGKELDPEMMLKLQALEGSGNPFESVYNGGPIDAVGTYTFSQTTGTYTEITGGTLLGSTTSDDQRFVDPAVPLGGTTTTGPGFPIGFNFTFDGVVFDRVAINANGWISFGQSSLTPSVNNASTSAYTPISSTTAITPDYLVSRIVPFGRDLQAQTGAELRIETIGTSPNQELVIQWKNYRKYNATGDSYNFQIRLLENGNLIKFVYGTMTNNATSGTAQVGLRAAPATTATNYANRTTTTDWTATTAGGTNTVTCTISSAIFPPSGYTFIYTPPVAGTPLPPSNPNPANAATGVPVSGNLTWDFGTNTVTYDLWFGPTGSMTQVVTGATAGTSGSYAYSGLDYNTNYQWQVIAYNGALVTNGPVWGFATQCGSLTPPYEENFDGTTFPPLCWERYVGLLAAPSTLITATAGWIQDDWRNIVTGDKAAKLNIWSTTINYWLVTPQIDLGTGGYQLEFDLTLNAYGSSNPPGLTGTDDKFAIIISTDGGITWTSANTLRLYDNAGSPFVYNNINPNGETVVLNTTAYTGLVKFGFYGESTLSNADNDLMINNLKVRIPPACPAPTGLFTNEITGNSAKANWTAGGTETLWNLEYGLDGFTLGTGTLITGITNPYYVITGLNPITAYDWYVQADCGTKDVSTWSGPASFTTACATFVAPFLEVFQNQTIPNCWTMSGPQVWVFTNTWPDYGADLVTDHTGTGGSFAGVDGSGSVSINGIALTTPLIDITTLTNPALKFYLFNNNVNDASYQTLRVDLWDGAAWNNNIYFWGPTDNNPNWVEVIVSLVPYTITGDIQFNFVVDKGPGSPFYDDLIIDDVSVDEGPTCPNPATLGAANITTTQADLTWVSISGLSDIEFGVAGFTPTGVPTDAGKTSPYTKTGLSSSSSYSFYVRDDCGDGDYSDWVGPYTFSTPCENFTAPYSQAFETWPPLCWDMTGGTYPWIQYVNTTTGVKCAKANFWSQTAGNTDIMTTNTIDVSGLTNPSMEFYWSHQYNVTYPNDALEVLVSDDNGVTWTQVWYKIGTDLNSNDGATSTAPGSFVSSGIINLSGFGDYLLIRFYGYSGYGPDLFVDDLSVFNAAYGTLTGYVYKYGTTTPIENATVSFGTYSTTSGIGGLYSVPSVLVGTYTVSCGATGYVGESAAGVVITDGGTTTQDFYLKWAEITVNPALLNENLAPDATLDKTITITNNAPAALNYSSNIQFLTDVVEKSKAAGDILLDIDVQATNLDTRNLGVTFDGTYYWISGGNSAVAPYKLYKHDQTGALIATFDQPTQATSLWGMRDLVYNAGKIYGGSEDGFYEFDIASGTFTTLFTGNLGLGCIRALAYYPATGNFLTRNFSGAITEFTSAGATVGTYTAPAVIIGTYGLAWDSWNNKLWLFDQDGPTSTHLTTFYEYDMTTMALTGTSYLVPLLSGSTEQIAGGALFSTNAVTGKAVLGGITQGTPNDKLFLMELNPTETWLSITANGTGTVTGTADGSLNMTVHFDATGFAAGTVKTANIIISSNALNAPSVSIPVTMNVIAGYKVSGNVYYGTTGTTKPMATNTTVALNPHGSASTTTGGYYELTNVADGTYKLGGTSTKAWGGLQAFDATLIARYLGSIVAFNDLQKRGADLNMSNTITAFDGTLIKRRLGSIATPQWTAPDFVFDGPFPSTPLLDGITITVSGADVTQELRTICSGDLNSSYTPPAE